MLFELLTNCKSHVLSPDQQCVWECVDVTHKRAHLCMHTNAHAEMLPCTHTYAHIHAYVHTQYIIYDLICMYDHSSGHACRKSTISWNLKLWHYSQEREVEEGGECYIHYLHANTPQSGGDNHCRSNQETPETKSYY